jgi:YHS domain-containing protein
MFRFIFYLILGLILYWVIIKLSSKWQGESNSRTQKSQKMVQDPTCGVYLLPEEALRRVIRGKEVFFCSEKCLAEFLKQGRKK